MVMLSTWHNNSSQQLRRKIKNNVEEQFQKTIVMCGYSKRMGGVISDQYISSYSFIRKSKKWWCNMFFWLLEVAVVNSFILYNLSAASNQKPKFSHEKYRQLLIKSLVGNVHNRGEEEKKVSSTSDEEERLNRKPHFIYSNENSNSKDSNRKINGGRRATVFYCNTCTRKPGLHPGECFEKYHSLEKYK
jgi:hypothetical protein